jgi:hypothetical protein
MWMPLAQAVPSVLPLATQQWVMQAALRQLLAPQQQALQVPLPLLLALVRVAAVLPR